MSNDGFVYLVDTMPVCGIEDAIVQTAEIFYRRG